MAEVFLGEGWGGHWRKIVLLVMVGTPGEAGTASCLALLGCSGQPGMLLTHLPWPLYLAWKQGQDGYPLPPGIPRVSMKRLQGCLQACSMVRANQCKEDTCAGRSHLMSLPLYTALVSDKPPQIF